MKSCLENRPARLSRMRYLMNTFCRIEAEAEDRDYAAEAVEEAFQELKRLERLFSRYQPDSEIARINRSAAKEAVTVGQEAFELIGRSWEFSRLSLGAFDVSVGAAVDFWRLCEVRGVFPAEEEINDLRSGLGYQKIILDYAAGSVYLTHPGSRLDLGAAAKGYGLSQAASMLKEKGLTDFEINLGGNIYLSHPFAQRVALRDPLVPEEIITAVSIHNSSISTSANYERGFTVGGRRLGHIINPLTGYPAQGRILSASVISDDGALADALSTAIFVLGPEKGRELLEANGIEGVIIFRDEHSPEIRIYHNQKGAPQ